MRLQGSQTRLGGDISRVKRESAGDGRKRKSVGKQAVAEKAVRALCERAALVAVEAARNVRRVRGAKFNCFACPCPCWLAAGPDPARRRGGVRGESACVEMGLCTYCKATNKSVIAESLSHFRLWLAGAVG